MPSCDSNWENAADCGCGNAIDPGRGRDDCRCCCCCCCCCGGSGGAEYIAGLPSCDGDGEGWYGCVMCAGVWYGGCGDGDGEGFDSLFVDGGGPSDGWGKYESRRALSFRLLSFSMRSRSFSILLLSFSILFRSFSDSSLKGMGRGTGGGGGGREYCSDGARPMGVFEPDDRRGAAALAFGWSSGMSILLRCTVRLVGGEYFPMSDSLILPFLDSGLSRLMRRGGLR